MKSIFVVIETIENKVLSSSYELITCAEKFSEVIPSQIFLVIAGQSIRDAAAEAAGFGHDVIIIEDDSFRYPNPELLGRSIAGLCGRHEPIIICFQHTMRACQTAAYVATAQGYSCITGIDAMMIHETVPYFRKPICNGKINVELASVRESAVVTMLPGAFKAPATDGGRSPGKVEIHEIHIGVNMISPRGMRDSGEGSIRIEESDIIVSAGRGIGGRENLELVKTVAQLLSGAAVGASRPICDLKWLPYAHQVGSTGRTVSPRLYIACGISGAQQHLAGMKNSQIIVSVNTDPQASINSIADYIVNEDLRAFLPVFIHKIKELKKKR